MKASGFSLVELSIVLVILGLLVGGVLAGQSLIRASELRAVAVEHSKYTSAIHAFRDKYFQLPGDFSQATRFWDAQTGATTDGVVTACAELTTAATDAKTCNGNGNGWIAECLENPCVRDQWYEASRFWQHLANAGLIEGKYTGVSPGRTILTDSVGSNLPPSKLRPGKWVLRSFAYLYSDSNHYPTFGHFFILGAPGNSTNSVPLLKPEEAWNIDTKLDNAKPGSGNIMAYRFGSGVNPACVADASSTTDYDLDNTSIACTLNFFILK